MNFSRPAHQKKIRPLTLLVRVQGRLYKKFQKVRQENAVAWLIKKVIYCLWLFWNTDKPFDRQLPFWMFKKNDFYPVINWDLKLWKLFIYNPETKIRIAKKLLQMVKIILIPEIQLNKMGGEILSERPCMKRVKLVVASSTS